MDTSALSDFLNQFLPTTWSSLLIVCILLVVVDWFLRHKLNATTRNSALVVSMTRIAIDSFLVLLFINDLMKDQYEGMLTAIATFAATRINVWYQSWDLFVDKSVDKIEQRFMKKENNNKQHE